MNTPPGASERAASALKQTWPAESAAAAAHASFPLPQSPPPTVHAVPAMLDNGGSIVIIGSDQSLIGKPEQHLYGCTKGAIAQLSKSLAAHYAPKGVRVNCICPGTIDTPLMHGAVQDFVKQKGANADELYTWLETAQPLPRLGRPEEVAALVACVAKIPFCVGSMISVDGGYTAQ